MELQNLIRHLYLWALPEILHGFGHSSLAKSGWLLLTCSNFFPQDLNYQLVEFLTLSWFLKHLRGGAEFVQGRECLSARTGPSCLERVQLWFLTWCFRPCAEMPVLQLALLLEATLELPLWTVLCVWSPSMIQVKETMQVRADTW